MYHADQQNPNTYSNSWVYTKQPTPPIPKPMIKKQENKLLPMKIPQHILILEKQLP